MNLFTTFTFGRLIKTFVPGLFWVAITALLYDIYAHLHGFPSLFDVFSKDNLKDHGVAIVFAVVILSVALGLWSNTLVFGFVLDTFVRNPVRNSPKDVDKKLEQLRKQVYESITGPYWERMSCAHLRNGVSLEDCINRRKEAGCGDCKGRHGVSGDLKIVFFGATDPEYLLLKDCETQKISFAQEQYWYYMELDINVAFSLAILITVHFCWFLSVGGGVDGAYLLGPYVLGGAVVYFLVKMAKKNYAKHTAKMISLLCSHFSEVPVKETEKAQGKDVRQRAQIKKRPLSNSPRTRRRPVK